MLWRVLFLLLILAGLFYQVGAAVALWRFRRRTALRGAAVDLPGISVLKPVRGLEPGLTAALESFLRQDYPCFEVLFGVADPHDPVWPVLQDLQVRYPQVPIRIVLCPQRLGANPKVSTLQQLLPQARHPLLIIADSDVVAPPELLRQLAAALEPPSQGLVSCLYRHLPPRTPGAALEALAINVDFIPSVAVAHYLEGVRFALGAVMAIKRSLLPAIGGLAALADHLADDYQLGWRVAQTGHRVAILPLVVETGNPRQRVQGFWQHQLRWARTYRVCRPGGFLAYGITFVFPWALLGWLTGGVGFWGPVLALLVRLGAAWICQRLLAGRPLTWELALLPFKDGLSWLLWLLSFLGDEVVWQGRRYRVHSDGRLQPL